MNSFVRFSYCVAVAVVFACCSGVGGPDGGGASGGNGGSGGNGDAGDDAGIATLTGDSAAIFIPDVVFSRPSVPLEGGWINIIMYAFDSPRPKDCSALRNGGDKGLVIFVPARIGTFDVRNDGGYHPHVRGFWAPSDGGSGLDPKRDFFSTMGSVTITATSSANVAGSFSVRGVKTFDADAGAIDGTFFAPFCP